MFKFKYNSLLILLQVRHRTSYQELNMKKQIADMDKEVQRELLNPSNDMDDQKKSYGSETRNNNYWKPPINQSYETLVLANTEMNKKVRPAGFRSNGRHR